jgi:predicted SprT family Zn-dependent metalloprotease
MKITVNCEAYDHIIKQLPNEYIQTNKGHIYGCDSIKTFANKSNLNRAIRVLGYYSCPKCKKNLQGA